MKGRVVAIDRLGPRRAAARIDDGVLEDLLVDCAPEHPRPETILRARLGRPIKGSGGRFVTLPGGMSGFLKGGASLAEGSGLAVQVTGFAEPGKAVPLTARLVVKGRLCMATPDRPGVNLSRQLRDPHLRVWLTEAAARVPRPEGLGLVLRSAAGTASEEELVAEIEEIVDRTCRVLGSSTSAPTMLWDGPDPETLARREWISGDAATVDAREGAFEDHGVQAALDPACKGPVALPSGGRLWCEPTRALVAVDVDTGPATGLAAGLTANLEAVRSLPRVLRLRGLGGQVTLDPAPMPKRDRKRLEQALTAALRADPVETALVGWTPLGHVELQRKRERLPLDEVIR